MFFFFDNKRYDDTDPISIETYAKNLEGHTFAEVYSWKLTHIERYLDYYISESRKGGLGNLLEEQYFGYEANSSPEADFPKAGVELKVTPYEKNKNGTIKAGERLVLGMISYDAPIELDFYKSHAWQKCRLTLLVYYWRNKLLNDKSLYPINFVKLFTPPQADLEIIIDDYKVITEKITSGKAHELSEADTMYLGACTKGSTAEKSTVPQYYGTHIPARKRAFCFKISYMTYVLNHYIANKAVTGEELIQHPELLISKSFEEVIQDKISKYIGMTDDEIARQFEVKYNPKSFWITLSWRMLGIKSNRAEEFEKANIKVKAIRIEANGSIKETMPFPTFRFKELTKEIEWEDSTIYKILDETKYLFVVFKKDDKSDDCYKLKGCQIWNAPQRDINSNAYECWKSVKAVLDSGVILNKKSTTSGVIVENNLPGISSNPMIHVRTHSNKTYYEFEDGTVLGDGVKTTHGDELPDGRWMTKHSFFLNSSYVKAQLRPDLK